jgi:repressor LexA
MTTTPAQQLVEHIRAFWAEHGYGPSVRDLMTRCGYRSPRAVTFHLEKLERAGAVERDSRARSVRLPADATTTIPVLGAVPAGSAALQSQLPLGELRVPRALTGSHVSPGSFALRVRGDSMVNAGIHDDDLVIVEQRPARANDIVVALVDGESTVKRLIARNGGYALQAENPKYPLIVPTDKLEIQGVVVGIFRKL